MKWFPALIVISRVKSERNRGCVGRTMAEIGERWAVAPAEAVLRLIAQEEGGVGCIGHGMSDDNVARVLAHPLVMVGSDGYSYNAEGPILERRPHPPFHGTFARVLGKRKKRCPPKYATTAKAAQRSGAASEQSARDLARAAIAEYGNEDPFR